ncbi:MAG: lytic transglycosylase domain-containing protein [Magnetococcus sp. DMHC-6]
MKPNDKKILFNLRFVVIACEVLLSFSILFFSPCVWADIFSFVDARGVVHLTDRPDDSRYRVLIRTTNKTYQPRQKASPIFFNLANNRASTGLSSGSLARGMSLYANDIRAAAQRHQLNEDLIRAVIQAESNFDPNAVSRKGAVGLMQLMPDTARMYGVFDSRDPVANIYAGTKHLSGLLNQFNNNLELSLAAYNAGATTVLKYGMQIPPYPETQDYVSRVLQYYRQYKNVM